MAGLTLKQTADLTNEVLQSGVIETMATESKLLAVLPFMPIAGNGYAYNVETELAKVGFRAVNQAYDTTPPETERSVEYLTILGGEAIVDTFQIEVHGDVNNLMAIQVALTAKSIAHTYEKYFINGDGTGNSFKGLLNRALPTIKATEDDHLDIDLLLDTVSGGASALIMNKETRRKLTAVARQYVTHYLNDFGVQVWQFGGVDIIDVESEILDQVGTIIALRFGTHEAVCGIQSTSGMHVKPLGETDAQPQLKTRIEWFCGMAVFNPNAVAIRLGK